MRNRQQREFRKSMRRMAREKKAQGYDDPYSYRFEYRPRRYRRRLFFGGGFVAFLIVLWNIYATSTWVRAWLTQWTHGQHNVVIFNSVPSQLATDQQDVNNYIRISGETENELVLLIKPYLNPNTLNSIATQAFSQTEAQFTMLRRNSVTTLPALSQLRQFNLREIRLMQTILADAKRYRDTHDGTDWTEVTQRLSEFNRNLQIRQALVVSVLNKEHMPYQILANGEIRYQYATTPNP